MDLGNITLKSDTINNTFDSKMGMDTTIGTVDSIDSGKINETVESQFSTMESTKSQLIFLAQVLLLELELEVALLVPLHHHLQLGYQKYILKVKELLEVVVVWALLINRHELNHQICKRNLVTVVLLI